MLCVLVKEYHHGRGWSSESCPGGVVERVLFLTRSLYPVVPSAHDLLPDARVKRKDGIRNGLNRKLHFRNCSEIPVRGDYLASDNCAKCACVTLPFHGFTSYPADKLEYSMYYLPHYGKGEEMSTFA